MTTKSQTDNTELDEWLKPYVEILKETAVQTLVHNNLDYKPTPPNGLTLKQAIQAKLKEQDIKSRIDELETASRIREFTHHPYIKDRLKQLRSSL